MLRGKPQVQGLQERGLVLDGVWGSSGDGLRSHRAEDGTWQLGVAARGVSFRKRA